MTKHGVSTSPQLIEPEERWNILGHMFEVWEQAGDQYAVKCRPSDGDSFWLQDPESRFDTLGGARIAILTFCEGLE